MKAGLLGAIGGVGAALQGFGSDLQKRREQALDDARELAKEQRREAVAREREDRATGLRIDLAEMSQTGADRRAAASQAAITGRAEKSQEFQREERIARAQASKDLATYRAQLSKSNQKEAAVFKQQLSQGDVKGIKPGRTREDGFVEVIGVRKDGKAFPTGQWVVPNFFQTPTQNFGSASDEDEDSLLLPEEEEEE